MTQPHQHHTEIEQQPDPQDNDPHRQKFRAVCDCGYTGPWKGNMIHADDDGDEHILGASA